MSDKLTAHQSAEILGYSIEHMRQLLREGKVKAVQFNRVRMIDRSE